MALLSSALLRLNDVELQLDLPETPGAAPATGVAATTATATAPVLQRDFVPREEVPAMDLSMEADKAGKIQHSSQPCLMTQKVSIF